MGGQKLKWARQVFDVKVSDGPDGWATRQILGHVKGIFALDRRLYFDDDGDKLGWVITHLPTGFVVRGVQGPLHLAKTIADELASGADWNFDKPADCRRTVEHVQAVMSRFPACVKADDFLRPEFVQ